MGDAHIYNEHIEGVYEQINRTPHKKPFILICRDAPPKESSIDEKIQWLETLKFDDLVLEDYNYYPAIKYKMVA